jgi:two-component system cell cycle sensor histidine kinase PleC
MARAEVASASAHSDSIKGLAQSIAKPAYRRLLIAEPALRRAVPALIIAFLLTIGVGAIAQVLDHRRQAISEAIHDIDNIADFASERFDRFANAENGDTTRRDLFERALSVRATALGRRILLSNADGIITATAPPGGPIGDRLLEVIGDSQPLTILGASAGVLEITLADGSRALATVRTLARGRGPVDGIPGAERCARAVALRHHADGDALGHHRLCAADPGLRLPLAGDAGARGRCDLRHRAQPHRHRAQSRPLRPLGLGPGRGPHLLVAFDVCDPRPAGRGRPADLRRGQPGWCIRQDIELYEVAAQLADAKASAIDHEFRMHHASGKWVWLRARCELVRQPNDSGVHLIGIAVDVTEQKTLVERTAAADLRLRDAIETIPEAFVLWDNENRLVLCNSNFQDLHNLPDRAVMPGTPYEDVVEAGRKHAIRSKLASEDKNVPVRAPSKPSSTTAIGCRSASAAPRMAAMSRSAPTSPRSSGTRPSWSTASSACSRPSTIFVSRSRSSSSRPSSWPNSRRAPRMPTRQSPSSWPT